MNQKSLETVFFIDDRRHLGDKWQSKTLFLTIFYLPSSIVLTFLINVTQCWSTDSVCKQFGPRSVQQHVIFFKIYMPSYTVVLDVKVFGVPLSFFVCATPF